MKLEKSQLFYLINEVLTLLQRFVRDEKLREVSVSSFSLAEIRAVVMALPRRMTQKCFRFNVTKMQEVRQCNGNR